ncbi:hypothetical protein Q9L58_002958 [Maublancomyces gigas]|uniref:Uncharacterized protein n=1 Tax=Discina gigas TaxID=1032678 RepID=A0ABR3GQL2_9PEZI
MSDNSRAITPWPSYLDFSSEPSRPPRLSPRPVSSVYSEYVPSYLDPLRPGRVAPPPLSTMLARPSGAGVPPRVRSRDLPFPTHKYSVAPLRQAGAPASAQALIPDPQSSHSTGPPTTRMERGRGIVINPTTATALDPRRMYFDLQLGGWRSIPGMPQPSPTEDVNTPAEPKKRDRFKKLARDLVQALKDLKNPKVKQERDNETRRAKLRASISAPLSNRALRR